jgi:hypothetical protein
MRASLVVKCQSDLVRLALRSCCQAQLPVEEIQGFGGGQSSLRYGGESAVGLSLFLDTLLEFLRQPKRHHRPMAPRLLGVRAIGLLAYKQHHPQAARSGPTALLPISDSLPGAAS